MPSRAKNSFGPRKLSPGILKSDVLAPKLNILAGLPEGKGSFERATSLLSRALPWPRKDPSGMESGHYEVFR